ncbi:hypothetical protein [Nannocystis bainbridge]|uniref:Lipoprotein n=1 Tax=Nannocystis bainbridge TaxID=2995303 RepID=A0ABT5E586_9BACT|nr:hypothetical protein [Nannocystis bainbridge]MDC0721031.1 hypothetical protein [Nannocystis bainbridge]
MRALATIVAMLCGCARGSGAAVVVPPRQPPPSRAPLSERGDVEIGLGAVTTAVAAALVGVGTFEAVRAARVREACRSGAMSEIDETVVCSGPLGGDPFVAAVVSSSLSFAFAVPIAVGGGFLLRRGIVARKAWKSGQPGNKMSLRPWSNGQTHVGLTFGLRF